MNSSFELHKLKNFVTRSGKQYTFRDRELNEFGEPTSEDVSYSIQGVYHEAIRKFSPQYSEAGIVSTRPQTMLFCLKSEITPLKKGMVTQIGNRTLKIAEIQDIGDLGLAVDIYLDGAR